MRLGIRSLRAAGAVRPCLVAFALLAGLLAGCYVPQIRAPGSETAGVAPPVEVVSCFGGSEPLCLRIHAADPGREYEFDPAEKDAQHAACDRALRFRNVEIEIGARTIPGRVLASFRFTDDEGNRIEVPDVDLLRIVPRLDLPGEMQWPELLLEEYERFGVNFRREHDEFRVVVAEGASAGAREALARGYRLGIWNNCLDPGKWEMVLDSEDFTGFDARRRSPLSINQQRVLAHIWFPIDRALYDALVRVKNPHLAVDLGLGYEELSRRAEQVRIDFSALGRVRRRESVTLLELGHESGRALEPFNREQYFKWEFGLFLDREEYPTYREVVERPVRLARFADAGFYQPDQPVTFDYRWLGEVNRLELDTLDVEGSECYVQLTLSGDGAPYRITLGNVDLALLDEQSLTTYAFGFNPYPKTRRHTPRQSTIAFDTDVMPREKRPYLVLTDAASDRWINNQALGLERVYLGWESIDKDILAIYVVSYERIVPVWMARLRVSDAIVDRGRVRQRLYAY